MSRKKVAMDAEIAALTFDGSPEVMAAIGSNRDLVNRIQSAAPAICTAAALMSSTTAS